MRSIKGEDLYLTEIDAAITHRLYANNIASIVGGFLLAVLVTISAVKTGFQTKTAYLWFGCISFIYIARLLHNIILVKKGQYSIYELNQLRLSLIITSIAWSAIFFIFIDFNNQSNEFLMLFALTGLLAAASMSYSLDKICLFGFVTPIALAIATRYLLQDSVMSIIIVLMTMTFLFFVLIFAKRNHAALRENFQLAITAEANHKKERAYSRVMEMLAKKQPIETILTAIVQGIEEQFPNMIGSIILLDPKGKHLVHIAGPNLPDFFIKAIDGLEIGPEVGSCGAAIYLGERVIAENIQTHPNWVKYRAVAAKANLASCWSEPIKSSSGQTIGSFAVYHTEPRKPSDEEIQLIAETAYTAEVAIELISSYKDLKLAAIFYENTNESIMMTDAQDHILSVNNAFTKRTGYNAEEVIGLDPSLLKSGKNGKDFFKTLKHRISKDGHWSGEIWNRKKNGEVYAEWLTISTIFDNEGNVVNRLSLGNDITKRKESEETIWRQANFDSLTNLPNRRLFQDRLRMGIRKSRRAKLPLALLFIDIDHFKEVNDSLGHPVGDLLLKESARRLRNCVRDTDTSASSESVSRLGGDEFTIILEEIIDGDVVKRVANRILTKLSEPYQLNDELVYISASIGITVYPDDSKDFDTLIKNADQAMYAAKRLGRNQFSYFTKSMEIKSKNHLELSKDLRVAIAENQFELHYQPIIDLKNSTVNKAEGLLRWNHPKKGMISPADFIPVAEDTGLIVEIGDMVFLDAVKQVKQLRKSIAPSFQISINKSPVQFQNGSQQSNSIETFNEHHQYWVNHLKKNKLPADSIAVEITESLLLEKNQSTIDQLLILRKAGFQISLDDFGTGYSSLAYIKKFSVDYIKIDQSFVQNLTPKSQDLSLCEAMITMAHKLNLKVIAEGIETQEQLALLKKAGCDYGQGYFFSRPLPSAKFKRFLNRYNAEEALTSQ